MWYLIVVSLGEQVISCLSTPDYQVAKQSAIDLESSNRLYIVRILEVNKEIHWKGMKLKEE